MSRKEAYALLVAVLLIVGAVLFAQGCASGPSAPELGQVAQDARALADGIANLATLTATMRSELAPLSSKIAFNLERMKELRDGTGK
jgi:hypothetical protein